MFYRLHSFLLQKCQYLAGYATIHWSATRILTFLFVHLLWESAGTPLGIVEIDVGMFGIDGLLDLKGFLPSVSCCMAGGSN